MDEAELQGLLDAAVTQWVVPGAQLGLLHGDDRTVLCSGFADPQRGEPVQPATAFAAGSITKALTGLVVLRAARSGALDLDAPCSEQGAGLWSDTPRSLLRQTTGRQNLLPDPDEEALDAFVARVADLPRVHQPGRFSYCNAGWSVLDLLLQRTTGRSFEDLALDALGNGTRFGMPEGAATGFMCFPGQVPVPAPPMHAPAATAAGSRWWASAEELLDFAVLNLTGGAEVFDPADVAAIRKPTAALPGATVFDFWGMGWAVWDRGPHQAFGWAGFTPGHRAFLRCFPQQRAAVVLLANSAGPLFGPPGGSALFDALLPDLLEALDVPPLLEPLRPTPPTPARELAGGYGPLTVSTGAADGVVLEAAAFGATSPVACSRLAGNTFEVVDRPPGSIPIAFDEDLLYVGPFAMPRT